jgi:hypothetical protein
MHMLSMEALPQRRMEALSGLSGWLDVVYARR